MNMISYSQTIKKLFKLKNDSISMSQFESIISCHDTNLLLIKINNQYGIIDKNGTEIIKPDFDEITQPNEYNTRFSTDFVLKTNNEFRIVSQEGKLITDTN